MKLRCDYFEGQLEVEFLIMPDNRVIIVLVSYDSDGRVIERISTTLTDVALSLDLAYDDGDIII